MRKLVITSRLTNRETESFNHYLQEIAQIDVFTPEEELECSIRAANGDKKATEELIKRNLRFVVSVAKYYASAENPVEDLVNEGNIGLIRAAQSFDLTKENKFISYAVWWIRKCILESIAINGRAIRIPANKLNDLSKINAKIIEMEQTLGRSIDIQEVVCDIDADDLDLLGTISSFKMDSTDREIGGKDGSVTTLGELLTDDAFKATDHLVMEDENAPLRFVIETLKPKEQQIITLLYGLNGDLPLTLEEVGKKMNVTRESIRQTKVKILAKLKTKLETTSVKDY